MAAHRRDRSVSQYGGGDGTQLDVAGARNMTGRELDRLADVDESPGRIECVVERQGGDISIGRGPRS